MSIATFSLISGVLSFAIVQVIYSFFITPEALSALASARAEGLVAPRNFFVVLMDFEQQICVSLFLLGASIAVFRLLELSKHTYLFDVDLLQSIDVSKISIDSINELEAKIPIEVRASPIFRILDGVVRRYALTKSIDAASNAIEPALESESIRNENELSGYRYIVWAVPSIGFLGTVRGIGQALADADMAVAGDIGPMTQSLGVAFNSTFVALIISLVLTLVLSGIQKAQDDSLLKTKAYVEETFIFKVSRINNG